MKQTLTHHTVSSKILRAREYKFENFQKDLFNLLFTLKVVMFGKTDYLLK